MLAWFHKEKYFMKNYELLTIFKPSLDSEELDKVVDKISEEVKLTRVLYLLLTKWAAKSWLMMYKATEMVILQL